MKKLLYLLLVVFSLTFLISCETEGNNETVNQGSENEELDFSNVNFESITVDYDGQPHSVYATNIPEGVTVVYSGNEVVEVGNHTVIAKFYDENEKFLHKMSATITILQTYDFSNVKFDGIKVKYDGNEHNIYVKNKPNGVTVRYEGNGVIEVGRHTVTAKFYDKEQKLLHEMTAVIIIEELLTVDLSNVIFEGIKVLYDGKTHSIYVVNLPEECTVVYEGNDVKTVGTHTVTAKIFDEDNNLVHEMTAIIKIVESTDVELPLV